MTFSVIEECADRYRVIDEPDGSVTITIHVPRRFVVLVTVKLTELSVTEAEIEELAPMEDE